MTRVKICGVRTEEDLRVAVNAGADAVGLQVGQVFPSDSFILSSTAQRLAVNLPPYVAPVLVTHLEKASDILELMEKSGVRTVQLHSYNPEETALLRDRLEPNAKIIQTLYTARLREYTDLEKFHPLIDAFNLDCFHAGAAELENDGGVRGERGLAEFLAASPLPVILSGRLDAATAERMVRQYHPFAVDSCHDLRAENGTLDAARTAEFIRRVRLASEVFSG